MFTPFVIFGSAVGGERARPAIPGANLRHRIDKGIMSQNDSQRESYKQPDGPVAVDPEKVPKSKKAKTGSAFAFSDRALVRRQKLRA
jgi:hypothetical protein